ncbi:MAG: 50S ribosomal protein L11 methyltransferase [SAR202 cluster bacterium]|nr:50S ribosomal protein L11 methyltransferase [SAR202 cluster bacterium]
MKWLEFTVKVPPELVEPVSQLFGRYGHGVAIEDSVPGQVSLRTYLTSTSTQRRARIDVGLKLIGSLLPIQGPFVVELDGENWAEAWKSHFSLLRVGRNLVIKPPWIPYTPQKSDHVIELDPGMAFGTGRHPTTRMCLEALEDFVKPGTHVLDVGTGSGILSIASARLGAERVVGLDVDPTALKVARKALRANSVQDKVALVYGSIPHPKIRPSSYHLLVTNISAKVVQDLAPHLHAALKPGGHIITAGFLDSQEAAVTDSFKALGLSLARRAVSADWVSLIFRNSA